jgi:hypothetical protein
MGQSILILGGGPSTKEVDRWKDITTDDIMSVSTAYKNPDIRKTKLTHYAISVQTDFTSEEFKEWYSINNDCQFIIEQNHLWRQPNGFSSMKFKKDPLSIAIKQEFSLGIVPRMILWAIANQYEDIYFTGLDGYAPDGSGGHAFRTDINKLDPNATLNTYDIYLTNFLKLYTYLQDIEENSSIRLHNLGKGHPCNILSHINFNAF